MVFLKKKTTRKTNGLLNDNIYIYDRLKKTHNNYEDDTIFTGKDGFFFNDYFENQHSYNLRVHSYSF